MNPFPAAFAATAALIGVVLPSLLTVDKPVGYIVPILVASLTAFALYRTGATRALKAAAEGWENAFNQKEQENKELRRELERHQARLAKLESLPNLARLEQAQTYFQQADQRHGELLAVLKRIDAHLNGREQT